MPNQRARFPVARRIPEWTQFFVRSEVQALGTGQSLGDTFIGAVAQTRTTIVRVRGRGVVHMVSGSASDSQLAACGLIIVSNDAFFAGAASLPSPLENADSPWLWHGVFTLGPAIGVEVAGDQANGIVTVSFEIDSKAQRKIGPNEVLAFMWDGEQLAASPTFDGNVAVRMLSLHP